MKSLRQTEAMGVLRFEPLRTERLVIRAIRADDAGPLWERRNDPSTAEFQNWSLPYPRAKAQELVDEMLGFDGAPPLDGWIQLAVDDAESGVTLGDLALGLTFAGRCAEIGWTIDATARGRGIATEAATALARWLFDTVGVTRVQAMMHPGNGASVRIAERLGMVFEGHTRNSYWVGDENSDDWIFAMTPDEWRLWVDRLVTSPVSVALVEVSKANLDAVERLATHRSQQRFVATMAQSFADALVQPATPWYRAVEADGEIVGFVMASEPTPECRASNLWRLLIDRMHQRRGVGGRALDLLIDHVRSLGADTLQLSWMEGSGSPAPFYLARGFEPTGEISDGEIVARLDLTGSEVSGR